MATFRSKPACYEYEYCSRAVVCPGNKLLAPVAPAVSRERVTENVPLCKTRCGTQQSCAGTSHGHRTLEAKYEYRTG